jgi:hypothetical protein
MPSPAESPTRPSCAWSFPRRNYCEPYLTDLPASQFHSASHFVFATTIQTFSADYSQDHLRFYPDRSNHVEKIRFTGQWIWEGAGSWLAAHNVLDNDLLPRGPSLPGRICTGSHLTCRYSSRNSRSGWHRACGGEEGHEQAIRAGHISGEAVHFE